MKTQFQCELLTDVVLNMRTATTGNQKTLDFIPGSCFLGIVASSFKQFTDTEKDFLFSGKVKFGDAHITNTSSEKMSYRSLHVPASLMYPKLLSIFDCCYIHHFYKRENDKEGEGGLPKQLKQSRSGYYIFHEGVAVEVPIHKGYALKSAYDRDKLRAADEQMYGYESLDKGSVFLFEVETDNNSELDLIEKSLIGLKRIGRSRTAQYGLVKISKTNFFQPESHADGFMINNHHYITVYADGRLIFFDENGGLTSCPKAEDLGVKGKICWEKSQIRTFQYAPYNFKRQTRDADLFGIEKGSVFVIETQDKAPIGQEYVGSYNNVGFGKVIYNPDFLDTSLQAVNGEALYKFKRDTGVEERINQITKAAPSNSPLLNYLVMKRAESEAKAFIYQKANEFVSLNKTFFQGADFASQWGNIRSIAMRCRDNNQLYEELFDKHITSYHYATPTDPYEGEREINIAYLSHGIAEEKWKKRNRRGILRTFIDECVKQEEVINHAITIEAVINLASEMAKKCKKR